MTETHTHCQSCNVDQMHAPLVTTIAGRVMGAVCPTCGIYICGKCMSTKIMPGDFRARCAKCRKRMKYLCTVDHGDWRTAKLKKMISILEKIIIKDKSPTLFQLRSNFPQGNIDNTYEPMNVEECAEMILHRLKTPTKYELSTSEDMVMLRFTSRLEDSGCIVFRIGSDEYMDHGWFESKD